MRLGLPLALVRNVKQGLRIELLYAYVGIEAHNINRPLVDAYIESDRLPHRPTLVSTADPVVVLLCIAPRP